MSVDPIAAQRVTAGVDWAKDDHPVCVVGGQGRGLRTVHRPPPRGSRRASRNSCWTSGVERQWQWPGGDQGCTRTLSLNEQAIDSDRRMVHQ
jgi:hypothetical protein